MNLSTTHFCSPQSPLQAYLPVRQYDLTLKHRLLDQLGSFSHLILDALLAYPAAGRELVQAITGLNDRQLQPVTNRLSGLGLLDQGRLTGKGQRLAQLKRHLHASTRKIWLDADYRSHRYFGDESLPVASLDPRKHFILKSWSRASSAKGLWPTHDWTEDCYRQQKKLSAKAELYLALLFEDFSQCFVEHAFILYDWEIEVRIAKEFPNPCGVEIAIDVDDMLVDSATDFMFSSPLILLKTLHTAPALAPEWLEDKIPPDALRIMSFISPTVHHNSVQEVAQHDWVWPPLEAPLRELAVNELFSDLKAPSAGFEPLFNREHRLQEMWHNTGFNWPIAHAALEDSGLQTIEGEQ